MERIRTEIELFMVRQRHDRAGAVRDPAVLDRLQARVFQMRRLGRWPTLRQSR
jgi:hypothetical protein